MAAVPKNNDEPEVPVEDEQKPEGDSLDDLFEPPDAEALYAKADDAIGRAAAGCRTVGPKEACDALEALRPVVRAFKPKRAAPEPEMKPGPIGCSAESTKKKPE